MDAEKSKDVTPGGKKVENVMFNLWYDWLMVLAVKRLLPQIKNELNNFTSTIINYPYFYYDPNSFFDFDTLLNEIRCLDLTYLMEQRLRFTRIRDDIELSQFVGKHRQKCQSCLANDDEDSEGSKKRGQDPKQEPEGKDVSGSKTKKKNAGKMTDFEKDVKEPDVSKISESEEQGPSTSQTMKDSGKSVKKPDVLKVPPSEEKERHTKDTGEEQSSILLHTVGSEKTDQESKESKTKPSKKKKTKNLDVLKRFWFRRDPSPPPKNQWEDCLDAIRQRVRKELRTLLFLNAGALERRLNKMKKYVALLDEEMQKGWDEFIDRIWSEYELLRQPKEYNNNKLLERLKKNPELLEALDKMKPVKNTPQLIMDESNEIARRIEKQFFEIIPGIPGLTTYRNLFLCEMAKDDIKSVEVTDV